jgi:hypothetical protein
MSDRELLIQEIELLPDELVPVALRLISAMKVQHQVKADSSQSEPLEPALPYQPASGRSILRHAGKWQGDDFEECLQRVRQTRSKAN